MREVAVKVRTIGQLARVRQVRCARLIRMIDAAPAFVMPTGVRYMLDFMPKTHERAAEMADAIESYVPNWQRQMTMVARYSIADGLDCRIDRELKGVLMTFARLTDLFAIILHSMEDTRVVREPIA